MGHSATPRLDFAAALDGGFLDTLCDGGGGAGLFGLPGVAVGADGGGSLEGSSVSDPAWARARDGGNVRKRKTPPVDAASGKEACLGKAGEAKGPDFDGQLQADQTKIDFWSLVNPKADIFVYREYQDLWQMKLS